MEVLEEEYGSIKEEVAVMKADSAVSQTKDAAAMSIRAEAWRLCVLSWAQYFHPDTGTMDPAVIASSVITNALTKARTTFQQLWKSQACVIIFLRRFG